MIYDLWFIAWNKMKYGCNSHICRKEHKEKDGIKYSIRIVGRVLLTLVDMDIDMMWYIIDTVIIRYDIIRICYMWWYIIICYWYDMGMIWICSWYDMIWYGYGYNMLGYDMLWHDMVWYEYVIDMIWYGMGRATG